MDPTLDAKNYGLTPGQVDFGTVIAMTEPQIEAGDMVFSFYTGGEPMVTIHADRTIS